MTLREHDYAAMFGHINKKRQELSWMLPGLPGDDQVAAFTGKMWATDRPLIDAVRRFIDNSDRAKGRGFEDHHEWVAANASYVAALECAARGLEGRIADEVIQRTWRLGLLHDIGRTGEYAWTKQHQVKGAWIAEEIMREAGIDDQFLADQVYFHDDLEIKARNNPQFDIPMFSVFVIDHINWGINWIDHLNELYEAGASSDTALSHCKVLQRLLISPNIQQTFWGREVGEKFIKFGIETVKNLEEVVKSSYTA